MRSGLVHAIRLAHIGTSKSPGSELPRQIAKFCRTFRDGLGKTKSWNGSRILKSQNARWRSIRASPDDFHSQANTDIVLRPSNWTSNLLIKWAWIDYIIDRSAIYVINKLISSSIASLLFCMLEWLFYGALCFGASFLSFRLPCAMCLFVCVRCILNGIATTTELGYTEVAGKNVGLCPH